MEERLVAEGHAIREVELVTLKVRGVMLIEPQARNLNGEGGHVMNVIAWHEEYT